MPIPQVDIGSAFSSAADATVGESLTPAFSPYANDLDFFLGAFIFEVRITRFARQFIKGQHYMFAKACCLEQCKVKAATCIPDASSQVNHVGRLNVD